MFWNSFGMSEEVHRALFSCNLCNDFPREYPVLSSLRPGSPRIHLGYIKLFKNNKHRLELAWRTAFCAYLTKCK